MDRKHWEKEKLLVMSNFSFFHSVFKKLSMQTRISQGLFMKGLIPWSLWTVGRSPIEIGYFDIPTVAQPIVAVPLIGVHYLNTA